jgi:hypothetical protein
MNTKHFYIITCAIVFSSICRAQIDKGNKLLGGSIGFTSSKSNSYSGTTTTDSKLTAINLSASYGKAVRNNVVNGFSAGFSFAKNPFTVYDPVVGATVRNNRNRFATAGVFKRRYLPLGKNFYAFGQLSADLTYGQNDYEDLSSGAITQKVMNRSYAANASLYPGLSYQLNKCFMLDLGLGSLVNLGFSHSSRSVNDQRATPKTNTFNLNSNLSLSNLGDISVGFRVLFRHKKERLKSAS